LYYIIYIILCKVIAIINILFLKAASKWIGNWAQPWA